MKVSYAGYDKSGGTVTGSIEAATIVAAREQLKKQGLFVTRTENAAQSITASRSGGLKNFFGKGSKLRDVSVLLRQMAVLVSTGTTVVDAILVHERQLKPGAWRTALQDVRTRVEEGAQLSEAMASQPEYFDAVCRSLVAAGESRGKLGEMLQRLASLMRQQMRVRGALIGAMVYPCLLSCIAAAVMALMMGFVLPRFEGLFATLGAPLPSTTQVLMSISAVARAWWWAVLGALVVVGVCIKLWMGSASGRRALDIALVRTPQIGRIVRCMAMARIARVLGVLLEGKVTLLDALALTRQSTTNSLYTELMAHAEECVTRGEPVSAAFADPSLVSTSVCEALRAGERTGQIGAVLLTLADFMDEDNEVVIKSLTSIVEPLILVVLGVMVGFVAISMFMPLFDLAGAGGGAA